MLGSQRHDAGLDIANVVHTRVNNQLPSMAHSLATDDTQELSVRSQQQQEMATYITYTLKGSGAVAAHLASTPSCK